MTRLTQTCIDSSYIDRASIAFVSRLFSRCSPSTIRRRIRKIVIDSVNRVNHGWTLSHISKERGEGSPFITDRNASSPITRKAWVVRIGASLNHMVPGLISAGSVLTRTVPVNGIRLNSAISLQTAATLNAFAQLIRHSRNCFSAITLTHPQHALAALSNRIECCKSAKTLSSPVNSRCHVHHITERRTNV